MMEQKKDEKVTYPKYAPGTHVSTSDIYQKNITYSWWEPEVQYAWSLGPAYSRFLEGLKEGKILGIHCHKCKRVIVPPRSFCEYCYGPTDGWIELPDTGIIETYSVSYLDPDANRIEEPILIGVIDIDGADEHHGFMHYFGEMSKDEIKIGMKVKAVWKPEDEREGSITDIKYFKPLRGGE
ncbi:MAG: DNA-binding protein [Candidatus Lokiarchaeota archaeon]|nr:DNA-binding protein [Candidatus Lokiarchaeota archaeon]MBD3200865.1 DNA-binding protein [Candidatus Lokiarchaeota archaeon]